jgi:hypothetical protein
LFTEFADHVAVPKILAGIRDRVEGHIPESLEHEATEIAIWVLAMTEFAISTVLVFRCRQWWRAWCFALASGFLLLFAWYAHAPAWMGAVLGSGIALFGLRSSHHALLRKSQV